MPTILIVEDMKMFATVLERSIANGLGYETVWAETYQQAQQILESEEHTFMAALVDLTLPDSMDGEIVDLVAGYSIPTVVFTGHVDESVRNLVWSKSIVDYVIKDNRHCVEYILDLLQRLESNRHTKLLVVDDSKMQRNMVSSMVANHLYQVQGAESGEQALEMVDADPEIKLVISDYNMPGMNGAGLTSALRERKTKEELGIIGISAQGGNFMSAEFIKNGANDFLHKPFLSEEFYCRINHTLDMMDMMRTIRMSTYIDSMTGLWNRRYLFDKGSEMVAVAAKNQSAMAVAMLDIDKFKTINDTFGHDVGDLAIMHVANELKSHLPEESVLCRFGGDEFCVLLQGDVQGAIAEFSELVKRTGATPVPLSRKNVHITLSVGVCQRAGAGLEELIKCADELLYDVKQAGRNNIKVG